MAIVAPNGFRPIRHLTGGVIRTDLFPIASGLAANIFYGDVVLLDSTGYIARATNSGSDISIIGSFCGVEWTDVDGTPRFEKRWPTGQVTLGGADAKAYVWADPNIVFEVQCATGVNFAQTMVGNNVQIVATAGDTASGMSRETVSLASPAATTAQVRIMGQSASAANSFSAAGPTPSAATLDALRIECIFWQHLYRTTVGV